MEPNIAGAGARPCRPFWGVRIVRHRAAASSIPTTDRAGTRGTGTCGDLLQTAATLKGRAHAGKVAALGAGGNLARQAVSEAIPGRENMTLGGWVTSAAADAALAGGTQLGVNAAARAFDRVRPHNVAARYVNRALSSPEAGENRATAAALGMEVTPGQEAGSKVLLTLPGGTEGSPTAPLMFALELAKAAGSAAMHLEPMQVVRLAAATMAPRRMAHAMTDPAGRVTLRTVFVVPAATKARSAAALFLLERGALSPDPDDGPTAAAAPPAGGGQGGARNLLR